MVLFFPQVNILEKEYTQGIHTPVFVSGASLLKNIHVSKLQVAVRAGLVFKPQEESVLVEIIIHHLAAKVNMHLIIGDER